MFTHIDKIVPRNIKVVQNPLGRFYITPEGNKYPSITTLLGAKEKPWLAEWRSSLGEVRADKETKRTATRGDAVHLMTERYLRNDPDPTNEQQYDHISEFNTVKLILNRINNVLALETPLYSDILKIAGRVDCVAEYAGVPSVIDFKTSTNSKSEDMVQDYLLQCSAYALMFHELYEVQIDQVVIIMSVEKGFPLVFKRQVENYIGPLCERINTWYTNKGSK